MRHQHKTGSIGTILLPPSFRFGTQHSNCGETDCPGNPLNPTFKITKTSSGNWTLYENTKSGYIKCNITDWSNGMRYPQIDPNATTSTSGVEYKLTFI